MADFVIRIDPVEQKIFVLDPDLMDLSRNPLKTMYSLPFTSRNFEDAIVQCARWIAKYLRELGDK